MAEIDVLKAQLVRADVSYPWGFRFQGGAATGNPLRIMSVRTPNATPRSDTFKNLHPPHQMHVLGFMLYLH